jgi:hypothetical protein
MLLRYNIKLIACIPDELEYNQQQPIVNYDMVYSLTKCKGDNEETFLFNINLLESQFLIVVEFFTSEGICVALRNE